jgi:glycosyltransferase involved in cell wall biosynthesis
MNIGMILDNAFPPDPRVENEAFTLINKGHKIYLFCLDYSHEQKEHEIINGINVCRERPPKYLYRFSALAYTITYYHRYLQGRIYNFIKTNDVKAVHIHDIQVARSVFNVNKKLRLPLVLDLHENRPEIMKSYPYVTGVPGKFLISPEKWKNYEYQYIKSAEKVIVVTREAKKYYLDNVSVAAEKIHVVPNFVSPDFNTAYKTNNEIIARYRDRYVIIYIGDTGLRRGLATAISALELLVPEIPDILLLFIGKSKTDYILKDMVRRNKMEKHVEFAGWQDKSLFPSYLLASRIGICPIHRNLHHDTTYANKLFQYMAFGRPVLVSDCTAQKNLVNKYRCGMVFRDRDVRDFADKILSLYKDSKLYKQLSENSVMAVESSLNWDKAGRDLVKLYDEL